MHTKRFFFIAFVFIVYHGFSQATLFTINEQPFYTKDFIASYAANKQSEEGNSASIAHYLPMYVAYQLKVKEAEDLQLDTLPKIKQELSQYKKELAKPYLVDDSFKNKLLKEAYARAKKEVKVSHIMLKTEGVDTLKVINDLLEARQKILEGQDFKIIAKQYSQDPSVKSNGGNLGYFTVFQMIYPFENVAYTTKIGEISKPFKTKFGYHILQVNAVRKARGKVAVSHILLSKNKLNAKRKIDSIYYVLQKDISKFEELAKQFSEDSNSAINNGKVNTFGVGEMDESFANAAFSLQNKGDITKPIKTNYGWHIIKLRKKYPLESFKKLQPKFLAKINSGARATSSINRLVHKIKSNYNVVDNTKNINALLQQKLENRHPTELFTIDNKAIYYHDFLLFYKKRKKTAISKAFTQFKNIKLIDFYIDELPQLYPTYKKKYKEFREGVLLFNLLEKKILSKLNNQQQLQKYYHQNKSNYKNKPLELVQGKVMQNFKEELEKEWVILLKSNYNVTFNELEKAKILKTSN